MKLNFGKAYPTASQVGLNEDEYLTQTYKFDVVGNYDLTQDHTISAEVKHISFGRGTTLGGSFGYMFNNKIGFEFGLNYKLKTDYTLTYKYHLIIKDNSGYQRTVDAWQTSVKTGSIIMMVPALVIKTEIGKIKSYARFGMILGLPSLKDDIDCDTSSFDNSTHKEFNYFDKAKIKTKYKGGLNVGINGAIGAEFPVIDELVKFFTEVNLNLISYKPLKEEVTSFHINGYDKLSTLGKNQKETDFSDSYTNTESSMNGILKPSSEASKSFRPKYSFSSIAIYVGLKYNFE
jgi:hypothetical protein